MSPGRTRTQQGPHPRIPRLSLTTGRDGGRCRYPAAATTALSPTTGLLSALPPVRGWVRRATSPARPSPARQGRVPGLRRAAHGRIWGNGPKTMRYLICPAQRLAKLAAMMQAEAGFPALQVPQLYSAGADGRIGTHGGMKYDGRRYYFENICASPHPAPFIVQISVGSCRRCIGS